MGTVDELIEQLPNWAVVIMGILFTSLMLYIVVGGYMHGQALNANPRFTIGYVTGTSYVIGPSSHSVAFFTYSVGDSTYQTSWDGDLAEGCTRCLVKFAAADPKNIEFFPKVCIPGNVERAPAEGWAFMPFAVPATVFK